MATRNSRSSRGTSSPRERTTPKTKDRVGRNARLCRDPTKKVSDLAKSEIWCCQVLRYICPNKCGALEFVLEPIQPCIAKPRSWGVGIRPRTSTALYSEAPLVGRWNSSSNQYSLV